MGHSARVLLLWAGIASACGGTSGAAGPSARSLSLLQVVPDRRVARVGDAFTLGLTGRDTSGGSVSNLTAQWTSSNSAVATLDSAGRVQARGEGTAVVTAVAGGQQAAATLYIGAATFDLANLAPPRFVVANHHQLGNIYRISRYRSGIGHSNGNETIELCRNLKHYYEPLSTLDWTTVAISSPVEGMVSQVLQDGLWGVQIHILPRDFPDARVTLYHVAADASIVVGAWVSAGQRVGAHSSQQTLSDISVYIVTPQGERPVSLFDVMSDSVFADYQARGVASRETMIITKAERDADPIPCVPEAPFPTPGHIENWVYLH
jgi:hypothetical protein